MDRSSRTIRRRASRLAALSGLLLVASVSIPLAVPTSAIAASGPRLDVTPEDGTTAQGGTVVLQASIFDTHGAPDPSGHTILFFFLSGSDNDPGGSFLHPDLTCHTGSDGDCSVSYVAAHAGEDSLLGFDADGLDWDSGSWHLPDLGRLVDVVHRTISPTPTPTPTPTPEPTPLRPRLSRRRLPPRRRPPRRRLPRRQRPRLSRRQRRPRRLPHADAHA